MDVISIIALVVGIVGGAGAAISNLLNKQRFVAQVELLQAGNDELRSQNQDLRNERIDLVAQVAACKEKQEGQERLIATYKQQPNLTHLTKIINNNHKEIMAALAAGGNRAK